MDVWDELDLRVQAHEILMKTLRECDSPLLFSPRMGPMGEEERERILRELEEETFERLVEAQRLLESPPPKRKRWWKRS